MIEKNQKLQDNEIYTEAASIWCGIARELLSTAGASIRLTIHEEQHDDDEIPRATNCDEARAIIQQHEVIEY